MSGVTTPGTRPARLGKGEPPAGMTIPPQGSGYGSPLEYPTPLQAAPPPHPQEQEPPHPGAGGGEQPGKNVIVGGDYRIFFPKPVLTPNFRFPGVPG